MCYNVLAADSIFREHLMGCISVSSPMFQILLFDRVEHFLIYNISFTYYKLGTNQNVQIPPTIWSYQLFPVLLQHFVNQSACSIGQHKGNGHSRFNFGDLQE